MKKTLIFFGAILIVLFGVLSLIKTKNPYAAEKRFWKARNATRKILSNPETTPPALFRENREEYEAIIRQHPPLAKESLLAIAGLLIHEKEYDEARDLLAESKQKYAEDAEFGARAQFLAGYSYEKEGNWREAVQAYEALMEAHIGNRMAFQIPLYIARQDLKKDTQRGAESYEKAIAYYRRLSQGPKENPTAFNALNYLYLAYHEQQKWEEALGVTEEIVVTYPRAMSDYALVIEGLGRKLNQPEKAIAVFESFIQSHPDHPIVPRLKERIQKLGGKRQNVPS